MKVKLITASLKTGHCIINGKPDKRFKTGYRIMRDDYMTFSLNIRLSNPETRFMVYETIITQYGNFIVTRLNNIDGWMDLTDFRSYERGDTFEFSAEIDIMNGGYMVGEGSTYPTLKFNHK